MQDIGEHQLLMLLLVIESDFQNTEDFAKCGRACLADQPLNRRIDMRAILADLIGIRPRDHPALRPRVTRAGRDIIGIEQEGEALVVDLVAPHIRLQQEGLEEPRGVRAMPLDRTRIRHRLDDLIFS